MYVHILCAKDFPQSSFVTVCPFMKKTLTQKSFFFTAKTHSALIIPMISSAHRQANIVELIQNLILLIQQGVLRQRRLTQ